MEKNDIDFQSLPELPGVYVFRDSDDSPLYVGRATDLRSRVRSYFSERLGEDRGERLVEMRNQAKRVECIPTDSVLDAYILEAKHIKEMYPPYNVVDKDDKSFQFVGITEEDFPRFLVVRGRNLEQGIVGVSFSHIYGPFPRGALLKEAMKIIRKIFPFRDSCVPYDGEGRGATRKKCFRAQLGLCPGMCAGLIDKREYAKRVREIRMFFEGKKKQLMAMLEREMKGFAKKQEFEKAEEVKRRIFALRHIQDVSLIAGDPAGESKRRFRIEGYDTAHLAGKNAVGVMSVLVDGEPAPNEYRSFIIRNASPGDDVGALREILGRRLRHHEWRFPHLIVVDGGSAQIGAAQKMLEECDVRIPIVSVVKTEKHTPREVLGDPEFARKYEKEIIRVNSEAHRFAISRHRQRRARDLFDGRHKP